MSRDGETGRNETERLRAIVDRLLPVGQMYVDAFSDDSLMSLPERLRLQEIEDILADPDGWTPAQPIGSGDQP